MNRCYTIPKIKFLSTLPLRLNGSGRQQLQMTNINFDNPIAPIWPLLIQLHRVSSKSNFERSRLYITTCVFIVLLQLSTIPASMRVKQKLSPPRFSTPGFAFVLSDVIHVLGSITTIGNIIVCWFSINHQGPIVVFLVSYTCCPGVNAGS